MIPIILVANNDSLQSEAIKGLLLQAGYSRIHLTACNLEAEKLGKEMQPNFFILGYGISPIAFIAWIEKLRRVSQKASIVSIVPDMCPKELTALVARQVSTILHISDAKDSLVPSLVLSSEDNTPLLSTRIQQLVGHTPPISHPLYMLSRIELKIASLVLQGFSNNCISSILFRSMLTIEDHRKHIKNKLGIEGGKNALIEHLIPFTHWIAYSS